MKYFEDYLQKMGYSWNDFDRTYEMANLIEQYADEKAKQVLSIANVGNSEVFEHYGKPFTNGRELWDFLTANYNFIPKT